MATGQQINLENGSWAVDQPERYEDVENCVHLWPKHGHLLNDVDCMNDYFSICEVKIV